MDNIIKNIIENAILNKNICLGEYYKYNLPNYEKLEKEEEFVGKLKSEYENFDSFKTYIRYIILKKNKLFDKLEEELYKNGYYIIINESGKYMESSGFYGFKIKEYYIKKINITKNLTNKYLNDNILEKIKNDLILQKHSIINIDIKIEDKNIIINDVFNYFSKLYYIKYNTLSVIYIKDNTFLIHDDLIKINNENDIYNIKNGILNNIRININILLEKFYNEKYYLTDNVFLKLKNDLIIYFNGGRSKNTSRFLKDIDIPDTFIKNNKEIIIKKICEYIKNDIHFKDNINKLFDFTYEYYEINFEINNIVNIDFILN